MASSPATETPVLIEDNDRLTLPGPPGRGKTEGAVVTGELECCPRARVGKGIRIVFEMFEP